MMSVPELPKDERIDIQERNKILFQEQERKKNKFAGLPAGSMISRTQSAPTSGTASEGVVRKRHLPIEVPALDKEQLRPPPVQGKSKGLVLGA